MYYKVALEMVYFANLPRKAVVWRETHRKTWSKNIDDNFYFYLYLAYRRKGEIYCY